VLRDGLRQGNCQVPLRRLQSFDAGQRDEVRVYVDSEGDVTSGEGEYEAVDYTEEYVRVAEVPADVTRLRPRSVDGVAGADGRDWDDVDAFLFCALTHVVYLRVEHMFVLYLTRRKKYI